MFIFVLPSFINLNLLQNRKVTFQNKRHSKALAGERVISKLEIAIQILFSSQNQNSYCNPSYLVKESGQVFFEKPYVETFCPLLHVL